MPHEEVESGGLDRVFIMVNNDRSISSICENLREAIGVPRNVNQLLRESMGDMAYELEYTENHRFYSFLPVSGPTAITSDSLEILLAPSDSREFAANPNMRCGLLHPFAFAIMIIRGGYIDSVIGKYLRNQVEALAEHTALPCSWPELGQYKNLEDLSRLAVQHISRRDLLLMNGGDKSVNSIVVAVMNFTLLGSQVNPCDPEDYAPFLSYLREDDTLQSLTQRFGAISGDSDWSRCKLALVKERTPNFISNTQTPPIWEQFNTVFPDYQRHNYDLGEYYQNVVVPANHELRQENMYQRNGDFRELLGHPELFPQIGIQRSVADMGGGGGRSRARKMQQGSIKIS